MYRVGLLFLGLLGLALCAAGAYVAWSGDGWLHVVVEGLRAALFGACGVVFLFGAATGTSSSAKMMLADFFRDVFSRQNFKEFAIYWVVVALAIMAMLLFRD
jgi:hypothetical protein